MANLLGDGRPTYLHAPAAGGLQQLEPVHEQAGHHGRGEPTEGALWRRPTTMFAAQHLPGKFSAQH